jgi:hypothetical protein
MAPSGEEVIINDEIVINNLHHILTWKSQSDKDMVMVIAKSSSRNHLKPSSSLYP